MSQGLPPSESFNQRWRGDASARQGDSPPDSGRGKKLVGLLAALLALSGAVFALFFYLRGLAPPDFLSLAIREYKAPLLPPNAWALQDSVLLAKRFDAAHVERPYNVQDADGIQRVLKDLRKKSERPVVIHLSALARAADGKVYLLAGDADPDRLETWLPLGEVLQKVRDCPAPARLLILDIMRPIADARLGIPDEDIAEQTQLALAREKDLPFYVFCACSAGQVSQVSEELGQSLFAYYLEQGLRGYADGHGPAGKKDQRIMATELAEFVKGRVDRWARQNRGLKQTPVLVGQGADFALADREDDAVAPESPAPLAYPPWLRDAWTLRDKARQTTSRLGPGLLRHLEAVLLRTERRWRAGIEETRLKPELQAELVRFDEQVMRVANSRWPAPRTLAVAGAGKNPDAELAAQLRLLLPKALDPSVKLEEKDKAKKEELDKEIKQALAAFNKLPVDAARAIFEAAVAAPKLEPPQLLLLCQLQSSLELKGRFGEMIFLDRLKAFDMRVRDEEWDWPMQTVQEALRSERAAEALLAEAHLDPAAFLRVQDLMKKADDLRRSGEAALFKGQPAAWPQAGRDLQEAQRLYAEVQLRLDSLRKAREVLDRAWEQLPSLGLTLTAWGKDDIQEENSWKDAVTAAAKLADALSRSKPGEIPAELDGVAGLRQHLNDLQRYHEAKVQRCLSLGEDATGASYLDIQALLESPRLEGPRREALWLAGQKLGLRLLAATQAFDDADNQGKPATSLGADLVPDQEPIHKKWRARQTLDMLKLAGYPPKARLEQLLGDFKSGERNLQKADRLGRLLSPFDLAGIRNTDPAHWSQNPTLALYRRDVSAMAKFLGERYQSERDALEEGSPLRAFYTEAAEEFARFAATMK